MAKSETKQANKTSDVEHDETTDLAKVAPRADDIIQNAQDVLNQAGEKANFEAIISLKSGQGFRGELVGYVPYTFTDKKTGEASELWRVMVKCKDGVGREMFIKHNLTVQLSQQLERAQPGDIVSIVRGDDVDIMGSDGPRRIKSFMAGITFKEGVARSNAGTLVSERHPKMLVQGKTVQAPALPEKASDATQAPATA
jgi:hypothetical protein